jgi:hypothetical protein
VRTILYDCRMISAGSQLCAKSQEVVGQGQYDQLSQMVLMFSKLNYGL